MCRQWIAAGIDHFCNQFEANLAPIDCSDANDELTLDVSPGDGFEKQRNALSQLPQKGLLFLVHDRLTD